MDEVDMSRRSAILSKLLGLAIFVGVIVLVAISNKEFGNVDELPQNMPQTPSIDDRVITFFPDAASLAAIDSSYVEVYDAENQPLGRLLFSSPYSDGIYGFAGPTPLLIALDNDGKIIGTQLLENRETVSYVNRITRKGFFDSWNGCTVGEAIAKDVDAISGATLSSNAISSSLRTRLTVYDESSYAGKSEISKIIRNIMALLVIAWAIFAFFNPKKCKKTRIILLGASVVVLGFWQGNFLSLATFQTWIAHGFPPFTQWMLLLLALVAVLIPLIFGKHFYCTWLCPFGAVQEIAGKIKKKKIKLPRKAYNIRRCYLFIIIFLLLIGVISDLASFEPFSAFMIKSASAASLVIAGLFTILSVFISRPWCHILCPTGQLLEIVRSFSLKNIKSKKNEK
ncbi:4Fe-4S binding protein [Bacteroidales bacterium OttesenSCG-928-C03]|nr:4Fe-4S binding protein [Bacteroidales bacterium OttesenSCG-928-C03]